MKYRSDSCRRDQSGIKDTVTILARRLRLVHGLVGLPEQLLETQFLRLWVNAQLML